MSPAFDDDGAASEGCKENFGRSPLEPFTYQDLEAAVHPDDHHRILEIYATAWERAMDFDDQLRRYFGTTDVNAVSAGALKAGVDRMLVDLGMEKDRGRRFALWTLLHMLSSAPDLDIAFKDEADRNAARQFMELMENRPGD